MVPWVPTTLSLIDTQSLTDICAPRQNGGVASPTGEMIRVKAIGSIRRGNMGRHVCVYKSDSEEMRSISAYAAYGTI